MARYIVLAAAIGVVTWLSLAPAHTFAGLPRLVLHADKAAHFFMYGVLVVLGRWALLPHSAFRFTIPLVLGATTYGALMELAQGAVVRYGRTFDWGDILANSLGALCFWCLTRWLAPAAPAPAQPPPTP